jgi:hypothetical protein
LFRASFQLLGTFDISHRAVRLRLDAQEFGPYRKLSRIANECCRGCDIHALQEQPCVREERGLRGASFLGNRNRIGRAAPEQLSQTPHDSRCLFDETQDVIALDGHRPCLAELVTDVTRR